MFIALALGFTVIYMPLLFLALSVRERALYEKAVPGGAMLGVAQRIRRGEAGVWRSISSMASENCLATSAIVSMIDAKSGAEIDAIVTGAAAKIATELKLAEATNYGEPLRTVIAFGVPLLIMRANGWQGAWVIGPLVFSMVISAMMTFNLRRMNQQAVETLGKTAAGIKNIGDILRPTKS